VPIIPYSAANYDKNIFCRVGRIEKVLMRGRKSHDGSRQHCPSQTLALDLLRTSKPLGKANNSEKHYRADEGRTVLKLLMEYARTLEYRECAGKHGALSA
jgi:hypothetical protein